MDWAYVRAYRRCRLAGEYCAPLAPTALPASRPVPAPIAAPAPTAPAVEPISAPAPAPRAVPSTALPTAALVPACAAAGPPPCLAAATRHTLSSPCNAPKLLPF